MKQFKLLLLCALTVLSMGCTGGSSDPVKVAEQFAQAFCDVDYDRCNKFMDENNKKSFVSSSQMDELGKMVVAEMRKQSKKMKYKLLFNKEKSDLEEEDYAMVCIDITSKTDPDFKKELRIYLEKDIDTGKWLVDNYNNPF